MKKWRNFLIYIMSFFIVCVAVPQIRAKYFYEINSQNSENKNDAFNIHFPIESLEEQAANLALDSFLNILNNATEMKTVTINGKEYTDTLYNLLVGNVEYGLMRQGTSNAGDRNDSYVGNVVGDDSDDTVVLEALFGEENMTMTDAEGNKVHVTLMIKIDEVDSDNPVTGMQYSYTAPAEGLAGLFGQKVEFNFDGAEMILFASASNSSGVLSFLGLPLPLITLLASASNSSGVRSLLGLPLPRTTLLFNASNSSSVLSFLGLPLPRTIKGS